MEHNEHDANLALMESRYWKTVADNLAADGCFPRCEEIAREHAKHYAALYDRAIRAAREKARQSW